MYRLGAVLCCMFFVCLGVSADIDSETGRMISWLSSDNRLLDCVYHLNDKCVQSYARGHLEDVLMGKEISLSHYVTVERMSNDDDEQRDYINNIWSLEGFTDTVESFMKDHALRFQAGNIAVRMFESREKPDNLEVTVDVIPKSEENSVGTGKGRRMYKVIIPLVLGFKVTGMIIFGILATKLFLVKAAILSNTALLISGFIVIKKLYDRGMNMLNTHHHGFLYSHQSIPNYYGHDALGAAAAGGSGFGGYYGNSLDGLGAYSTDINEVSSQATNDVSSDLQGHFANHALALAALNKTLLYRQQSPKRRWSVRWAGGNS